MGFVDKLRTMGMSDSQKLSLFAKDGMEELDRNFKKLTTIGKLEVLILNHMFLLNVYGNKHSNKIVEIEIKEILKPIIRNIFSKSEEEFETVFLNYKTKFYKNEIKSIYNSNDYLLNNVYNAFYNSHLKDDQMPKIDLGELLIFKTTLLNMLNSISKSAKGI